MMKENVMFSEEYVLSLARKSYETGMIQQHLGVDPERIPEGPYLSLICKMNL